jgi:cytochrome c biogenesis protein CcmG, thiol:disulfide interchange protein DsbE
MRNKLPGIILSVLIILAVGWGIMWYMRKTIAPEMKFQTNELLLAGNNTMTSINDLKGNVVIVSFFQTWCGPCLQEMSIFDELLSTINAPGFKVLCISDEDTNRINRLQSYFSSGSAMIAYSAKSLASMGIHVYPTTYLLNKKGEVILSKLEGYNWALERKTIEKLLTE